MRVLEVENNTLVRVGETTKPRGLRTFDMLEVDTVIYCIGDQVDPGLGLPVKWGAYVTHPHPRFPVEGTSYEAYDPEKEEAIEGIFVAGWARQPSKGLVGTARKDGRHGAQALLHYLRTQSTLSPEEMEARLNALRARFRELDKPVVTEEDWFRLLEVERREAERRGVPEFKFATNEEMLRAIGKLPSR